MIRKKTGLKEVTWLMLASATLIGVAACGDDDDDLYGNTGGTSGSSTAGKGSGGSSAAGKGSGGSSGASAGTTAGGSTAGGTGGTVAGSDSGGETSGGTPSEGGASGEGGEASGGTPSEGGAGGEGGTPFVADTLDNAGFETGDNKSSTFPGWTNEGTPGAAYLEYASPHTGTGRLGHWTKWENNESPPFTARTYQTVSPIANGTYSFSMWVDRGWFDEQYLYATGFNAEDLAAVVKQPTTDAETPEGYFKITLSNIVVTSGSVTVGVYSAAPAGTYTNFDDAELTLVE